MADRGAALETLESQGAVRSPLAQEIALPADRVATEDGRVNLIAAIPEVTGDDARAFPLHLFSNSTEKGQSSQWALEISGPLPTTIHPDVLPGVADGGRARIVSAIGALEVVVRHDRQQRRDLVVVPKGGHFDRGWAANAIIPARLTDHGEGAAYLSTRVRIEPA